MSGVPNNPPAFPRPGFDNPAGMEDGMTLRDYYAGQALVGIGTWIPTPAGDHLGITQSLMARAEWAYRQADAMIAARKEGPYQ